MGLPVQCFNFLCNLSHAQLFHDGFVCGRKFVTIRVLLLPVIHLNVLRLFIPCGVCVLCREISVNGEA